MGILFLNTAVDIFTTRVFLHMGLVENNVLPRLANEYFYGYGGTVLEILGISCIALITSKTYKSKPESAITDLRILNAIMAVVNITNATTILGITPNK